MQYAHSSYVLHPSRLLPSFSLDQEEFCYGVLDHTTPVGTGRKWHEAKATFALARDHAPLWLAPIVAKVALLYDPDAVFAWQAQPQSTAFDFESEVRSPLVA